MLQKLRYNQNQKGFTLIELMIVIAIIGILAAIAIPQFNAYRIRSRRTKSMTLQGVARSAQGAMNLDLGGFGSSANGAYAAVDAGMNGQVLDSSTGPITGATDGTPGAQISTTDTGGTISAVGVDIPQGCIFQVAKEVGGVGTTYLAYSFSYTTDRVFATDFETQSNIEYWQDATFRTWPLNSGAFPGGLTPVATVNNDTGAGWEINGR